MKSSVLLKLRAKKMKEEASYWNKKLDTEFTQLLFPKDLSQDKGRWEKEHSFSLYNKNDIKTLAVWALGLLSINYLPYTEENILFWIYEANGVKYPFLFKSNMNQSNAEYFQEISAELDSGKSYSYYPTELLLDSPRTILKFSDDFATDENAELTICISTNEKATVKIFANKNMYSESSINLLLERFISLIEMPFPDDKAISEVSLYTKQDSDIYNELNNTIDTNIKTNFIDSFSSNVIKYPEKIAFKDKNSKITFRELHKKSTKIAQRLIHENYNQQVIGVATDRTVDSMIAILGILMSNNIYLPIDLSFPKQRINQMIDISEAKLLVTDNEYIDELEIPQIKLDIFNSSENSFQTELPHNFEDAYIIFTSGTTGDPKAVLLNHKGLVNRLQWMENDIRCNEDTSFIQKTKRTFDVSIWELFLGLFTGNTTFLLESGQEGNPEALIKVIQENKVTDIHFVPSMLSAFLDYLTNRVPENFYLKHIICSGEALKRKQVEKCRKILPNVEIINYYGPTEATIDVTQYHVIGNEMVIPIGKPVLNTKIIILDEKNNPKPIGTVGELGISGVQLAKYYKNNPQKTAASFIKTSDGVRVYKTGDLARVTPEGVIQYIGRIDKQVKIRGFRIEIEEIEYYLMQCPGIIDSAVVIEKNSQGQENLVGYYKTNGEKITVDAIRKNLSQHLPNYMIPTIICEVADFPVTRNGKLDRERLKELRLEQTKTNSIKKPRNEDEKRLCTIVESVLEVSDLAVDQNFFMVGGNSINFVSILANANDQGFSLEFQDIFANPTVEKLVEISKSNNPKERVQLPPFSLISEEDKSKLPSDAVDAYPMTQLQSGLIYQCNIMDGENNYHDIVTYTINGSIDIEIFKKCVEQLVDAQPIFRTTYNLKDYSENLQIVHKQVDELPISIFDLRGYNSEKEKNDAYERWFKEEESKPFNWGKTGLVKLYIHIMNDEQYKYSIGQHNSALDGWSLNKVHTFLFDKYFEMKDGIKSDVKITDNSHNKHFIYLEKQAINSDEQKNYWQEKLKGSSYFEIPRSHQKKYSNKVIFKDIRLPKNYSSNLISLADSWNVPVKSLLMSATIIFLSILTSKKDIITGYELGGRPETPGSEDSLGLYLNTVPFRIQIENKVTWREFVQKIYEAESELLPYRRYPMAQMKQDIGNKGMLFDTVFNFTHFYSLKTLQKHREFDLMNVRAAAVTEWPLRIEFSRHYYTDEVLFSLHYHTSEYTDDEISFFAKIFIHLLAEIMENNLIDDVYDCADLDCSKFSIYPSKIEKYTEVTEIIENKTESIETINTLKKIWSEILKINLEEISDNDDFYELGGNSIAALRVSMKLSKQISLIEIIKNSKLIELARVIDRADKKAELTNNRLIKPLIECNKDKVLIFIPYAAGNSINFKDAADAISEATTDLSIYSVEFPGHEFSIEEPLMNIDELTVKIIEEIKKSFVGKELYIWGHCVGAGLAISLTEQLEKMNINVKKIFIGSKLLQDKPHLEEIVKEATQITFDDIKDIYSEFGDISVINDKSIQKRIADCFTHDSVQGNLYLMHALEKNLSLKTPLELYVAKDDRHTSDYEKLWENWKSIFDTVTLKEIETGGHYYNVTNPEIFKNIIE